MFANIPGALSFKFPLQQISFFACWVLNCITFSGSDPFTGFVFRELFLFPFEEARTLLFTAEGNVDDDFVSFMAKEGVFFILTDVDFPDFLLNVGSVFAFMRLLEIVFIEDLIFLLTDFVGIIFPEFHFGFLCDFFSSTCFVENVLLVAPLLFLLSVFVFNFETFVDPSLCSQNIRRFLLAFVGQ